MFKLSINNNNNVFAYIVELSLTVWHSRLGHINFNSLDYMSRHELISCSSNISDKCEICVQAKMPRKSFRFNERRLEILELVHYDICELNGILTRDKNRYFITFINDHSRYTHVYLMKNKDQAFDRF